MWVNRLRLISRLVSDFKPCDRAGERMEMRLPFIERERSAVMAGIVPDIERQSQSNNGHT